MSVDEFTWRLRCVALFAGACARHGAIGAGHHAGPVPAQSQVSIAPTRRRHRGTRPSRRAPSEQARVMYWRPGHWMWDGANWAWTNGTMSSRPTPQAVWEPGHWVAAPVGGYLWVDGRWEG